MAKEYVKNSELMAAVIESKELGRLTPDTIDMFNLIIAGIAKKMSYKDLCEEDRFYVILSIRDLTFPEPESNLKIDHMSKKGEKHEIEIKKEFFQYFKIPAELDKYYDSERKSFMIETKSFGTIEMTPPVIGVMQKITAYIKEKQQKGQKVDQSVLQIIPYLHKDWRGFSDKTLFEFVGLASVA